MPTFMLSHSDFELILFHTCIKQSGIENRQIVLTFILISVLNLFQKKDRVSLQMARTSFVNCEGGRA